MLASFLRIILLSVLGIIAVVWFMAQPPVPVPSSTARVTYSVTGSGNVGLTFINESGGTEQKTVALPWTLEIRSKPGAFLHISAQKKQEDGTIVAGIYVDGTPIQKAESNSAYGIASVNGRVP